MPDNPPKNMPDIPPKTLLTIPKTMPDSCHASFLVYQLINDIHHSLDNMDPSLMFYPNNSLD